MPTVPQVLEAVSKIDESAATELVRLALYETLLDVVEAERPALVAKAAQNNDAMRRELVRKFIDARLNQVDVTPLMQAAGHLALVDYEISKADTKPNYLKAHNEQQGAHGYFQRLNQGMDFANQVTTKAPDVQHGLLGAGNRFANAGPSDHARSLGRILQSTGHPLTQGIGMTLDAVGQLSPEIQAAFGNHLKRLSYRYRGTQIRSDVELQKEMGRTNRMLSIQLEPGKASPKDREWLDNLHADNAPKGPERARGRMPDDYSIARYNHDQAGTRDQKLMRLRADVATKHLMEKLPDLEAATLSQKAGQIPPSRGIIIDRDGKVAAEATGYKGDHHLPFDLKNLGALHGGQYVRTRSTGGLTQEDIYAGIMTGARKVTVVSNSGVFTLEFGQDVRGGRRYSDKARQMVGRYESLLETVHGGAQMGQLDQHTIMGLKEQAKEGAFSVAQERENFTRLKSEAEARALWESEDEDPAVSNARHLEARKEALAEADSVRRSGVKGGQWSNAAIRQRELEIFQDMEREHSRGRLRATKLDAHGYKAAQNALATEFPQFIREEDYVPLEKWQVQRGLTDGGGATRFSHHGTDIGFVPKGNIAYGVKAKGKVGGKASAEEGATEEATDGTGAAKAPAASSATGVPGAKAKEYGNPRHLPAERQAKVDEAQRVIDRSLDANAVKLTDSQQKRLPTAKLGDLGDPGELGQWAQLPGHDVTAEYLAMAPKDQDRFLRTMSSATAIEEGLRDETRGAEDVRKMAAGLVQLAPFGEPVTDANALDTYEPHDRPHHDAALHALGPDPQKLSHWGAQHPEVKQEMVEFDTLKNSEVRDELNKRIRAAKQVDPDDKDGVTAAMAEVKRGHLAFAYKKALEMAGVEPGKAQAQSPGPLVRRAKRYTPLVLRSSIQRPQEDLPPLPELSPLAKRLRDVLTQEIPFAP